ncbi:MAG: AtpZ/AtpI family protein [Myxococcales bacterium]|nr:AtpZ/AtpI family protein [Myxococcales bacterium]
MAYFDPKTIRVLGRVSGIGLELAIFLLIGVKGGEWLDRRFDTAPVLQRVGLFFGIFAGFYSLWKLTRVSSSPPPDPRSSESDEREDRRDSRDDVQ